jgi:hypothetical protein
MGQCFSRARYECERFFDEDAWANWAHHSVRRYYKIGHMLGKGAFSQVRGVASTQHSAEFSP